MYVQAIVYANSHLEDLRAEAAERATCGPYPTPSLRERLTALAGSLRSAFADPTPAPASVVPSVH
jgi:hypothetical protein